MIRNFLHKGLKNFYLIESLAGIKPDHKKRLKLILVRLDAIYQPEDMNLPGFDFHKLVGDNEDYYSVSVNKNWRIIFKFDGKDAHDVDYVDYH